MEKYTSLTYQELIKALKAELNKLVKKRASTEDTADMAHCVASLDDLVEALEELPAVIELIRTFK